MQTEPYNIKPAAFSLKEGQLAYNYLSKMGLMGKADKALFLKYLCTMKPANKGSGIEMLSRNEWIDLKHLVSFAQHMANDIN